MDDTHDLELLLRSRIPLIIIETGDEKRVVSLFAGLAISLAMPVMAWSATTGLQRIENKKIHNFHINILYIVKDRINAPEMITKTS